MRTKGYISVKHGEVIDLKKNLTSMHLEEQKNKVIGNNCQYEQKMAQDGIILTEAQLMAIERKKERREAFGEMETEHPGYLGGQDTYYGGNIKA